MRIPVWSWIVAVLVLVCSAPIAYFVLPQGLRAQLFGEWMPQASASSSGSVCGTSPQQCDFMRAVLGSTEDVWREQFRSGHMLHYGAAPENYQYPTLVVFFDVTETGCGAARSSRGPFYCRRDGNLYMDPRFYDVLEQRLHSPGDFAQAYVIAHEIGHHIEDQIGAYDAKPQGETANQGSVRIELQADCLAGVWGAAVRERLKIDESDLREVLNAAHNVGDDSMQMLSRRDINPDVFTHGTSEQRMRWFRRGFDSGDTLQCDTMSIAYDQL